MSRPRTDYKLQARWMAAFILCVFVSANLAELFHQASVEHTICPEHGDASHHSEAEEETEPGEGLTSDSESEHGCEHCSWVIVPREGLTSTTDACGTERTVEVLSTQLEAHDFHLVTTRLYRLAPKTSPPACA